MFRFLIRRLLIAIPTMFLVVTLAFFMMRSAPGSPFVNERQMTPEVQKVVEKKYGFDRPLIEQYGRYLADVVQGDFGPSLKYRNKTVVSILAENFKVSLWLGLSAILLASVIGVSLGVLAALRQNRSIDYVTMGIAILGVCIPTFVTAPLLVLAFGSILGWLPLAGWRWETVAGIEFPAWRNMVLPVTVLALPQIAIISRLVRAGMIEVLRSNYVRTARSRGLPEWVVVRKHALRAAILPLVSYLGPACAGLLTGSLVVEKIFNLPGLGKFFVISALQRDYTVVMGMVIFYAALILVLNMIADMLYAALDPRVRLA
ncbi:MAG: ABC transporter permease [Caulobacter sp.]|jgi:oligopeptide transport system permease protein|nr:ABC transporter permease [Caulobacter sp.]